MREIRVLHVDDDREFVELAELLLERESEVLSVTVETSAAAGLDRIESSSVDCVVSDYDMPGADGLEFLRAVRERDPDLPFVLFTGKGSEEIASAAVSAGVSDYLQKVTGTDQFAVLANRVENLVSQARAEETLERKIRQQEAVATLAQRALEGGAIDELFDRAVETVAEQLGTDYAKILEHRPDRSDLLLVAGVGWDEGLVGEATVPDDAGMQAGYTLAHGPVVVADLDEEECFEGPDLLTDAGVRGGLSVTVGRDNEPWGVFGTHTADRRSFTDDEVTFVRTVANLLGTAIERAETERQLRESEEQFRRIAELSPDTIFRADTGGNFEYVSPAVEGLLGYEPAELVGTNFGEYVVERNLAKATEQFAEAVAGQEVLGLVVGLVTKDGSVVHGDVNVTPIEEDGETVAVQGFVRDVTTRETDEGDGE
ncbi:MAG: PAS domain S-box protein [Haloarculaceae archaeon]